MKIFKNNRKQNNKSIKLVSCLTIIFGLLCVIVIITWIMHALNVSFIGPKGNKLSIHPAGIFDVFYAPLLGFYNQRSLLIFIISIGAFIYVIIQTKTLNAFAQSMSQKFKNQELLIVPILMIFFSILGTSETFGEEKIPLYGTIIAVFMSAGFDKMTGFLVLMVGSAIGCMGTTVSPFVINIGFNSSGVWKIGMAPYTNGIVWRIVGYVCFTAIAITYTTWYAHKTRKFKTKSITFNTYEADKKYFLLNNSETIKFTKNRKWIFAIFITTLSLMIFYLINWDSLFNTSIFNRAGQYVNNNIPWITKLIPPIGHGGLDSTAPFFLIAAILIGFIGYKDANKFTYDYLTGGKNILAIGFIIATATGIGVILQKSNMQSWLIEDIKKIIQSASRITQYEILFLVFLPLSFLIPSTSGFLLATFPILGPILGPNEVPAVVTIAAWANGLMNLIVPTSFILMTALSVSKIEYIKLVKTIWPLFLILLLTCMLLILIGTYMPSNIF